MIVYREIETGIKVSFEYIRAKYQTASLYSDADFARIGFTRRDVVEVPSGAGDFQNCSEDVETLVDGVWTQHWTVSNKTLPEISTLFTEAIQEMLDAAAVNHRYDSIHTACGWAGAFADATALKAWGVTCWEKAGADEAALIAGTLQLPASMAAYIATFPVAP